MQPYDFPVAEATEFRLAGRFETGKTRGMADTWQGMAVRLPLSSS
jgi:hypothetical protein